MKKSERFGIVFTPPEQYVLKKMSDDDGVSMAAFVRRIIRLSAKERGLWPVKNMDIKR
jgi:hypothetical protein